MRWQAVILALLMPAAIFAADSTKVHELTPLEVTGAKLMPNVSSQVEANTHISKQQIRQLGIDAPKDISVVVPNVYMPDYGSRMTSSVYVRGLGARIDQPVMGLSVDNIQYLNKDAYDVDIPFIESIDVQRGACSILNGRNTMGGQINIRTLSANPYGTSFQGMAEYGTANTVKVAGALRHNITDDMGSVVSAFYKHSDGYFRNEGTGRLTGLENSGSLRWKTNWQPSRRLSITNTAVASIARQDGYPYASLESGRIDYADTCAYRRTSIADALTVAWGGKRVVVTSISSVQYLDDCMNLDQDFLPLDYFTLEQARKEIAVTEDLFTRGTRGSYDWLGGVYCFYKSTSMQAPVTFKDTGIERLIENHRNDINPDYPVRWDSRRFVLGSNFKLRSGGFSLYHQSSYRLKQWHLDLGLRMDIEKTSLGYNSLATTGFSTLRRLPDGSLAPFAHTDVNINDHGNVSHTYIELIPKLTASYDSNFAPYFSFSKGYKSGGYNTQMFSDVLQQRIMNIMGLSQLYTFDQVVAYKPEWSLNYELGFHWGQRNKLDMSLFYIDCRDQQLTIFPPGTTTGRMMTNAGRTRSYGLELSGQWFMSQALTIEGSYGYTNATFRHYDDGRANYRGKHVPYAPAHTLFGQICWFKTLAGSWNLALAANARCVGEIYWNEANTARQPFYCLPGLTATVGNGKYSLILRANNLTATHFDVFYFVSIGNAFVQRGLPRTISATLRVKL